MSVAREAFDAWLQPILLEKDIDFDIYGSYIVSILCDEGDMEMKKESIAEILQSFMEDDSSTDFCTEILQRWSQSNDSIEENSKGEKLSDVTKLITTHLNISKTSNQINKPSENDEERAHIKQSVIAMYNKDEDEHGEESPSNGMPDKSTVFTNTNASSIVEKEKLERSKQKNEAAKKRERDKQERKNQENKKAERKEKEKKRTQKKERNR